MACLAVNFPLKVFSLLTMSFIYCILIFGICLLISTMTHSFSQYAVQSSWCWVFSVISLAVGFHFYAIVIEQNESCHFFSHVCWHFLCVLMYALSLRQFHGLLRRICIRQCSDGLLYRCLLDPFEPCCRWTQMFLGGMND